MFELITPPGSSLFPGSFSKRFQYAEDIERQHVVKISKLAGKERTRIHLLSDHNGNCYGFVALSFSSFDRNFNRTLKASKLSLIIACGKFNLARVKASSCKTRGERISDESAML